MDLKGAEIRNVCDLCMEMGTNVQRPLSVNIPYYQRPYRWDDSRVGNLINDFYKNKSEQKDNIEYFVGSVVLVDDKSKEDGSMDIVDGQQRITTVFLLNFIRFLLLRAQVDKLIYRQRPGTIEKKYNELIDCYAQLLSQGRLGALKDSCAEIVAGIDEIQDAEDEEKNRKWEELLAKYRDAVGLPGEGAIATGEYEDYYCSALYKFLKDAPLAVHYSRSSYNENLRQALAHVVVTAFGESNPTLKISDYEGKYEGSEVNRYLGSIECAFSALNKEAINMGKVGAQLAEELAETIREVVENLQFCVVMTGNERDAYTLFEVLNDRAMEIDDLDLIKNLFYKTYCQKSDESDKEIDEIIGEEDKRWGEVIFPPDIGSNRAKRVSFYATIYLTADTSLKLGGAEKYREPIEAAYLSKVVAEKGAYTKAELKRDIDVFEMVARLLDVFGILESGQNKSAIKAQNDMNLSIACKAMRLFQALHQDGVSAALVNIIIRKFRDTHVVSARNAMEAFDDYLQKLKSADSENDTNNGFDVINAWARKLWKASLMAKDYEVPREIARMIIENVSAFNDRFSSLTISSKQSEDLRGQFTDWTDSYHHGTRDDLRVKILFLELLGMNWINDSLQRVSGSFSYNTDNLQLDHLEPETLNEVFSEFYYQPSVQNITRENVVNGLGNMMLADFETNVKMSNKPVDKRLVAEYKDQLQGHWLVGEIEDLLSANCDERNAVQEIIRVPTDGFFSERKRKLQQEFLMALGAEF